MTMWYLVGLFCLLALCVLFECLRNVRAWKKFDGVPGFEPSYFVGNVPLLRLVTAKDFVSIIVGLFQTRLGNTELFRREGIYRFFVGTRPFVMLTTAKTAEVIVSSQTSIEKSSIYDMGTEWFGEGLGTSAGETWRKDRKRLTPTFHFRILEDFLPIMNEQAAILVRKLKVQAVGKPWIDLETPSRLCALDIILETSMGAQLSAQTKDSSYASLVQTITMYLTKRMYRPWLHPNFTYFLTSDGKKYLQLVAELNKMTDMLIRERRQKRQQSSETKSSEQFGVTRKRRLALLDLLLEADIDEKGLRDQVSTFVFAGHHTISVSFVWLLYTIGLYPEVQAKMVEELDRVFDGDRHREVTQDDLKKLKYMTCVMKETQRIYPTAPVIARELVEDTKIGGFVIPKGTDCAISIASIHRDPEYFPDPELFDPDRFLPENASGRHPYAFIPFSAGPRNCIGQRYAQMELQTSLCHVLRSFNLRSLDQRDKVQVIPDVILRPVGLLKIEITNRV